MRYTRRIASITEGYRGAYPGTFVSHAMIHGKKSIRESASILT
jgi:hypothetical protein